MKITALAPWFGAKRTIAARIVAAIGPHSCYWEPFCGSMAVLLAKPRCPSETVNDLHGDLVNLARVLRDDKWGPALYRRLRRTWASEAIFAESCERCEKARLEVAVDGMVDVAACERAYDFFIASWLGRNGVQGTGSYNNGFCVRYTANGGIQGTRFASAVDSIPAWRRRLRKVTILHRDGFDLLERIEDAPGTAIYCGPPYLKKGATYIHDFQPEDHYRLAELLRRFTRSRIVVSYYEHPFLEGLYPGWAKQIIEVTKQLANHGQRGADKVTAREVLLANGPLADTQPSLWR